MKTEYQYLRFEVQPRPANRKTDIYSCRNKRHGEELGTVQWFAGWRQYCYFPTCPADYSAGCLRDIAEFLDALRETRG